MLQPGAIEFTEQPSRISVFKMPKLPADAIPEHWRIGAAFQHRAIVIALEHERLETGEHLGYVKRRRPDVSQHAEAYGAVAEHELHRLPSVVGHGIGLHLDIANGEGSVAVDFDGLGQRCAIARERGHGSVCKINRQLVATRKPRDAAGMILVLVRDDDGIDVTGIKPDSRKPRRHVRQAKAAIEKNQRVARFNEECVAAAAAAQ